MLYKVYFKYLLAVFCFLSLTIFNVYAVKIYDNFGFDEQGINNFTGTKFDWWGFDINGMHKITGTNLDNIGVGYDVDGYERGVIYNYSTVKRRFGKNGYNHRGFNINGIHEKTGTEYDESGFDQYGFNILGVNKYTKTKFDMNGYNKNGINSQGLSKIPPQNTVTLPIRA